MLYTRHFNVHTHSEAKQVLGLNTMLATCQRFSTNLVSICSRIRQERAVIVLISILYARHA